MNTIPTTKTIYIRFSSLHIGESVFKTIRKNNKVVLYQVTNNIKYVNKFDINCTHEKTIYKTVAEHINKFCGDLYTYKKLTKVEASVYKLEAL